MEIKRHFAFSLEDRKLQSILSGYDVNFKKDNGTGIVDIFESNPAWPEIDLYLRSIDREPLTETLYSLEELESAQWLSVRSCWHNGYPQPESDNRFRNVTYNCERYCPNCGSGLLQKHPFRIKKTPNWGRRNFFMLNWVFSELFVDEIAKNLLENSGLSGFSFLEVQNLKGNEIIQGTYQIIISTTLLEGLISKSTAIDGISVCDQCMTPKYSETGRGMITFKPEAFEQVPDIVKTAEIFGVERAAKSLIIISQKMYQFLTQNHIDKNLCFAPIKLEDSKTGDGSL